MFSKGARRALARVSGLPQSGTIKTGTAGARRGYGGGCWGVEHTVVESVGLEPDGRGGEQLIARVRPKAGVASRCSRCGRRCPGYDVSKEPRRWRGLDMGTTPVFLQATTRRVSCPSHGVVVAAVPWARAGSRFTTAFEDTAAWLVSPRHPLGGGGAGAHRLALGVGHPHPRRGCPRREIDRLAGLRRIGIDEISSPLGSAVSAGGHRS